MSDEKFDEIEGLDDPLANIDGPECMLCRHVIEYDLGECYAFRGKIPDDIMKMRIRHHDPYPGDHGLQFEPWPNTHEEMMEISRLHWRAQLETLEAEIEMEDIDEDETDDSRS